MSAVLSPAVSMPCACAADADPQPVVLPPVELVEPSAEPAAPDVPLPVPVATPRPGWPRSTAAGRCYAVAEMAVATQDDRKWRPRSPYSAPPSWWSGIPRPAALALAEAFNRDPRNRAKSLWACVTARGNVVVSRDADPMADDPRSVPCRAVTGLTFDEAVAMAAHANAVEFRVNAGEMLDGDNWSVPVLNPMVPQEFIPDETDPQFAITIPLPPSPSHGRRLRSCGAVPPGVACSLPRSVAESVAWRLNERATRGTWHVVCRASKRFRVVRIPVPADWIPSGPGDVPPGAIYPTDAPLWVGVVAANALQRRSHYIEGEKIREWSFVARPARLHCFADPSLPLPAGPLHPQDVQDLLGVSRSKIEHMIAHDGMPSIGEATDYANEPVTLNGVTFDPAALSTWLLAWLDRLVNAADSTPGATWTVPEEDADADETDVPTERGAA